MQRVLLWPCCKPNGYMSVVKQITLQNCVGDCAWDPQNPSKLEKVLTTGGHDSAVVAVAWQPAGNGLTTCDRNKTVVVWADIWDSKNPTWALIMILRGQSLCDSIALLRSTLLVLKWPPRHLSAVICAVLKKSFELIWFIKGCVFYVAATTSYKCNELKGTFEL